MSRSFRADPQPSALPDYWQVLGLPPESDAVALKRAFRQQARRWHPDLNGSDPVAEERFKLVNEAYAVLSDPERRLAWERGEGVDGADQSDPFAAGFPRFEDYLAHLFAHQGVRRGGHDDQPMEQPQAWRDGFSGGQSEGFSAGKSDGFRAGHGTEEPPAAGDEDRFDGSMPPGDPHPSSSVTAAPASAPPVPAATDSETTLELSPEQALRGGRVEISLRDGTVVEVWTPALAGDGWRLRLAGVAPGGADHFLHLRVRTPEGLRLDGLRVHYLLELSPADAVLGAQVIVPTLEGPVRLRVPPGSSSGRLLRLRGRGQSFAGQRGDQLVELRIVVPEQADEDEQALYRRLRGRDEAKAEAAQQP